MTPEELEAFRGWCRIYEMPPYSLIMRALEHIDQQAASLAEAEALARKNVELINGYLAGGISASRMEERERLQKQIAALQEIAVEQKAMRICTIPANWWNEGEQVKEYFRASARDQIRREHPEAFGYIAAVREEAK